MIFNTAHTPEQKVTRTVRRWDEPELGGEFESICSYVGCGRFVQYACPQTPKICLPVGMDVSDPAPVTAADTIKKVYSHGCQVKEAACNHIAVPRPAALLTHGSTDGVHALLQFAGFEAVRVVYACFGTVC